MIKNWFITICFIFTFQALNAQVTVSESQVDYSVKLEENNIIRILTFWNDKDSTIYHSIKYSSSDFNQAQSEKKLADEIRYLNQLWKIAEDSIQYSLQSLNIGYPLLYSDILKNHINAFLNSKEWQHHIEQNGKKLDYKIIKKVMVKNNVYQPLNAFLEAKGYTITGFSTEKHGFVTKENLQKAGFSGNEIIPMPYIVWIQLDHTK